LFCHITTQVEGDPYPNLLQEKGGMGFPHIVVMDATGSLLATHEGARNTKAFAATLEKAGEVRQELKMLSDQAKSGNAEAAIKLFGKQLELSHLAPTDALARMGGLKGLDNATKARFQTMIAKAEVIELLGKVTDEPDTQYACGKAFAAMLAADRIPPAGQEQLYFWYFLAMHAEREKDVGLMTKAVEGVKAVRGAPRQLVQQLEKRLEELKGDGKGGG
jgi:hypothetical protein